MGVSVFEARESFKAELDRVETTQWKRLTCCVRPPMGWSSRIDPEQRLVFCLESRLRGGVGCSPTNVRHGLHRHGQSTNVSRANYEVASKL
jgi:hypothetical protein